MRSSATASIRDGASLIPKTTTSTSVIFSSRDPASRSNPRSWLCFLRQIPFWLGHTFHCHRTEVFHVPFNFSTPPSDLLHAFCRHNFLPALLYFGPTRVRVPIESSSRRIDCGDIEGDGSTRGGGAPPWHATGLVPNDVCKRLVAELHPQHRKRYFGDSIRPEIKRRTAKVQSFLLNLAKSEAFRAQPRDERDLSEGSGMTCLRSSLNRVSGAKEIMDMERNKQAAYRL